MTKRLIDVDDAKLAAVRDLLGTTTLKATVDGAFDEVLALVARRRAQASAGHPAEEESGARILEERDGA